ncbi:MAG TPA: DNA polymerase/3'-5' exonuclease PolX [Thermoanaerobaculia bacterium]|nr:DNA polymerase/3'-5' exonuclease PolX [Thermoanaerobaculia bacterium]
MARADKWTAARVLDEIAQYVALNDPNRFKSRAFERAARAVENLDEDIDVLVGSGKLLSVPGIGKSVGAVIVEVVNTGESRYLDELRAQYPAGIFDLLRVPGLGLGKIGQLHQELGVGSLDELEAAAREGRLAKLRGFGPKTQTKVLEGIEKARRRESQHLLPTGLQLGERMRERLAKIDEIEDAEIVGSVRRRLEVIRNVNIAIATRKPAVVVKALERIVDRLEEVDEHTYRGVLASEIDVWFHLAAPAEFGTRIVETTGSREFVEALDQASGLRPQAADEKQFFEKLGVPYIEPERRESPEVLVRKKRPRLVEPSDLRGTFHVHTTFSDGRNTVLEMLTAARERGFDYVGISDHSPAAFYANGLTVERLREQHAEIARREPDVAPMRVFRGTEADILPDGSIDYGDAVLSTLDFVVASIHSRFNMPKDEMTERILKAVDDPCVTFLGHLTGRLLLSRDGYSVDYDRIFDRAAERGVLVEINGNPHRLDVDWRHIPKAIERGVMFVINPDAHSIAEMSHVISGTWVARKAGLTPKEIFNTRGVEEVAEWLNSRHPEPRRRRRIAAERDPSLRSG